MLSWDDFRHVKEIAEHRSLAGAAKALRINQSTVFRKLSQIEQRLGVRLFKRNRATYLPTVHGDRMAAAAARMAREVEAFARGTDGGASDEPPLLTGLVPRDQIIARSGLAFLTDMVNRRVPQPPICATLGFHLAAVAEGYARFDGLPELRHYNPIGTVHGGFAATLLDSALGCAVFTTVAEGEMWTTLEFKVNLVRPLDKDTGPVRAEGRIVHRGRTMATAEGTVKDRNGKLYAHASTTCMIFPAKS